MESSIIASLSQGLNWAFLSNTYLSNTEAVFSYADAMPQVDTRLGFKIHLLSRHLQPEDILRKGSILKKLKMFAHDLQLPFLTHIMCYGDIFMTWERWYSTKAHIPTMQLLKAIYFLPQLRISSTYSNLYWGSNKYLEELEKENATS